MSLYKEPLLTRELTREEFTPEPGASYIHGPAAEERSALGAEWYDIAVARDVKFVEVVAQASDEIGISSRTLEIADDVIALRDEEAIRRIIERLPAPVYIDVTGLTHDSWAPLLRSCLSLLIPCYVVYAEPVEYTKSRTPARGLLYDLSERIEGISPLPGFAKLRRPANQDTYFVPLLGFEGARLGYVLDNIEPSPDKIIPVIGVPGFRPEFPFATYSGNRSQLETNFLHARVRYAKANCPFDLFHALHRISRDFPGSQLRIAPIGTKPHGVGAILFAVSRPGYVEIIYDHPVRKDKRTTGVARVCVYDVGTFAHSELFQEAGRYATS